MKSLIEIFSRWPVILDRADVELVVKQRDECMELLTITVEAFRAAKAYIDATPCDPDIYPEQIKAWNEYQAALAKVKEVLI